LATSKSKNRKPGLEEGTSTACVNRSHLNGENCARQQKKGRGRKGRTYVDQKGRRSNGRQGTNMKDGRMGGKKNKSCGGVQTKASHAKKARVKNQAETQ